MRASTQRNNGNASFLSFSPDRKPSTVIYRINNVIITIKNMKVLSHPGMINFI